MGGPGSGRKKGSVNKKAKSWAEMSHSEKVKASNASKAKATAEIKKVQKRGSAGNQNMSNYPIRISGVGKK